MLSNGGFFVTLDLKDRSALVVGSDEEAAARTEKLVLAGARVLLLCASEPSGALCTLESHQSVHMERRAARPEDIDGKMVTYISTSEEAQAPALFDRAVATGRLLCTIDRPELSTFINPAVARAGPLAVAVSTGGASPALARRIREDLEKILVDPALIAWIEQLARARSELPRGERALRGAEAVRGFALEGRVTVPGSEPPEAAAPGQTREK